MATSKTLQLIALKLGLANEVKVLSKAAEFERLLQIKSTPGNNLSDTSKVVILLDLAASLHGVDFDQKTAVKYSGLKGPSYNNSRKVIQNLLELNNDTLSISTLCLNLQCTGVQDLAESILKEYEKCSKVELDLTLPQYVCMAVYQACRVNKIKKLKTKIVEKSRLKSGQWSKLDEEWTKFVDEKFLVKKRGRPPKAVIENENEMEIDTSPIKEISVPKEEPYEDWKRRMLEQAYNELKQLQGQKKVAKKRVSFYEEEILPRRSPRKTPQKSPSKQKTPQKFSPYKSPEKPPRLRLDFPKM